MMKKTNPAANGCPPGYYTPEEAYRISRERLDQRCRQYGLLK